MSAAKSVKFVKVTDQKLGFFFLADTLAPPHPKNTKNMPKLVIEWVSTPGTMFVQEADTKEGSI